MARKVYPTQVVLMNNRYVKRVGYEFEFKTLLGKLLLESDPKGFLNKYGTVDLDRADVQLDAEGTVARIIGSHKRFEEYRGIREAWTAQIRKMPGSEEIIYRAEREMVCQVVRGMVAHHMVSGAKRKLWCGSFEPLASDTPLHEWWRGPWSTWRTKRAVTGKYSPGYGDYEDYEPPSLYDQKHVLLHVAHYNGGYHRQHAQALGQAFLLLREDLGEEKVLDDQRQVAAWTVEEAAEAVKLTKTA